MLSMKPNLHRHEIEQAFVQTNMDLDTIVILDGIDLFPGQSGFRIRSHDLHGLLPNLWIEEENDPHFALAQVRRAACRLAAIAYIREELTRLTTVRFFHHPTIETTPVEIEALLA